MIANIILALGTIFNFKYQQLNYTPPANAKRKANGRDAKQWFKPADKRMISIADEIFFLFILLLIQGRQKLNIFNRLHT